MPKPRTRIPRGSKYGNKRAPSLLVGRSFHSQAERARGEELALLEKAGAIRNLRFQVPVPLRVNGKLVTTWIADFVWECPPPWRGILDGEAVDDGFCRVYEDLKGFRTDLYALKAKLFEAIFGFPIYESQPKRK